MVLRNCVLFIILLISFTGKGQQLFHSAHGTYQFDQGYAAEQTYDSGFVVAGVTGSGTGTSDFYLLKTGKTGNFIWQKAIGFAQLEQCHDLEIMNDSGFALAGFTNSIGSGGYDGLLVKTDSLGNMKWHKTFGGSDWDFIYAMARTTDNGFILTGQSYSGGNGNGDGYVVKTDVNGNIQWQKWIGGSSEDAFRNVRQTSDGGYVFCGYTMSYGKGEADFYLIRTDFNGDTLWTKTFGDSLDDRAYDIEENIDGGFVVVGGSNSYTSDSRYNGLCLRIGASGNLLYTQHVGENTPFPSANVRGICKRTSGGFMFTGEIEGGGIGAGKKDLNTGALDASGQFLCSKTDGSTEDDAAYSIRPATGGTYVVTGITESFGVTGIEDVYLSTVDECGITTTSPFLVYVGVREDLLMDHSQAIFYNGTLVTIRSSFPVTGVRLFDMFGREILASADIRQVNDNSVIEIETGMLSSGIYIVELMNEKGSVSLKLIR